MNSPESVKDHAAHPQMRDVVQVLVAIRIHLIGAAKLRDLGAAELIDVLLRDAGILADVSALLNEMSRSFDDTLDAAPETCRHTNQPSEQSNENVFPFIRRAGRVH